MPPSPSASGPFVAFHGHRRIARGDLETVALAVYDATRGDAAGVLAFDATDGRQVDVDLRGDREGVGRWARAWLAREGAAADDAVPEPPRGRGRPRLGVVSREVTLLPRHWAWLAAQGGNVSATLRRLVDQARRVDDDRARVRASQDAAFRFMSAVGGDLPGFEEAVRALYAGDAPGFRTRVAAWPPDVVELARALAAPALSPPPSRQTGVEGATPVGG